MTDTKFYIDQDGNYLGGFSHGNPDIPTGAIEVPTAPSCITQLWDFQANGWTTCPPKKTYKIYDYLNVGYDPTSHPCFIDYNTEPNIRFQPKQTFVHGELVQQILYAEQTLNPDGMTYTYNMPIVKETFVYNRDTDQFAIDRTQTITWYFSDGTEDTDNSKIRTKIYADKPIHTLQELIRRRDNNVKNIIGSLIPLIMATRPTMTKTDIIRDGQQFFSFHNTARNNYIYEGTDELEDAVRDSSMFAWFADDISGFTPYTTIRNYIIYELSMGQRSS